MKITNNFHIPIILISIIVAVISNFGAIISIIEPLTFTNIRITNQGFVSMTSFNQTFLIDNQWWRLISPMFIHFSFAHLAFNCLWIYILGEKIEKINGSFIFVLLVLVSSVGSNIFQFYWTSSTLFGGLSGVIYGLLGFCLIGELESEYDLYGLPPALYLFMIVWLILGFMGILDLFGFGSVANFAHLGGLISGIIFALGFRGIFFYDI
mgnify:CR=1 FL=1